VIESLTGQGIHVRHACRTLAVSESGYYAWKDRPTPPRELRRIWLAGEIVDVHKASGGTYGATRVRAELIYGRGIHVGHNAVELIMRRLGIKGLPTRRLPRGARLAKITSLHLVGRQFRRDAPDKLWMTDITEHPTKEGKIHDYSSLPFQCARRVRQNHAAATSMKIMSLIVLDICTTQDWLATCRCPRSSRKGSSGAKPIRNGSARADSWPQDTSQSRSRDPGLGPMLFRPCGYRSAQLESRQRVCRQRRRRLGADRFGGRGDGCAAPAVARAGLRRAHAYSPGTELCELSE
jgi:hypothetical protein